MSVEILSIPEQRYAPTDIPAPLVEHFKEQGKRLTLTSAMAMNVTQRMSEGRRIVMLEDLPEGLWKEVRYFFDRPTKWEGELHVGDCVLVAQSVENYTYYAEQVERTRKNLEESANDAGELNDKALEMLRRGGAPAEQSRTWVDFHPTHATKVSDHVKGGADLAAEIAAAAAASGKKK